MVKKGNLFLFTFLIFFLVKPVKSQLSDRIHEQLEFKYLTIDDGLNNNRVRGLEQDNYGFIWIGTRFGISRFDGYKIERYDSLYNDTTSFEFEETRGIFCDSFNTLWAVGVYGISRFDWSKNKFFQFSHKNLKVNITSCGGLDQDQEGNIWFATNQGLLKYHPQTNELLLYIQENNNPKSPPRGNLDKIIISGKDHVWYSYIRNGIGYFDKGKGIFNHFLPSEDQNSLAEERVERLYEDKQGNIWVGHNNNGVSKYSFLTGKFTRYYPEPGRKEAGRVRGIIEDGLGNFWFGTQGGLYLFNRENETFKRYAYTDHPISTLSHNSIQTMMVDNQEGLWLGTFAGGVSYANLNSSGIIYYEYSNIPSEYYLNDKSIYSLAFDKDENIWVGTENGGLNFLNRETGKFTYFMEGNGDENATRSNNIKDIYVDENGLVWFGTYKGGMSFYNPDTKKFRHYQRRKEFPQGLDDQTIFVVYPDVIDDKILWIGATSDLYMFDEKKEIFTRILPETPGFNNTPDISRIYRICSSSDKKLIFAATNMLLILDRSTNTFTTISSVNGTKIDQVNFAFLDKYGYIWAAINTDFIVRYDMKEQEFMVYDENKGLPKIDYLEGIDDNEGNIWLSSNYGMWKLENIIESSDSFNIVHYDQSDNVQSLEFLYHSMAKSPSGEILFGGINGFNSFRPENVKPNPYVPNVVVTKLTVMGEEVKVGEKVFGKVILSKPIMNTRKLEFHHKIKIFTFHFTGFHFVAPDNNKFKYMLEGYDEKWISTNANIRQAQYSNIPRGTYTFKVDASNNNGKWSDDPFEIEIKIVPPFWKTVWFFGILAIILSLLIYAFIKWRERQLKHDKEVLEEKLKKGKEEIEQSKAEVAKKAEELRQRDIAEKVQRWHNTGMIKLGDIITKNKDNIRELAKKYLVGLINYVETQQGAIFIFNDEDEKDKYLELLAGFALGKKRLKQKRIELEEGLVGMCFKDNETIIIDEVPSGYSEIGTGIGEIPPKQIILFPLKQDDTIIGVTEVSSIHRLDNYKIQFIEKIGEMFTSNLFTLKTNQKIKELLECSQQQAEEMQAQEEEMRQNMEEMQATQEEAARREQELIDLNKEMVTKEKEFKKQIREKERALVKAQEIINRQERELKKLSIHPDNKTENKAKNK